MPTVCFELSDWMAWVGPFGIGSQTGRNEWERGEKTENICIKERGLKRREDRGMTSVRHSRTEREGGGER